MIVKTEEVKNIVKKLRSGIKGFGVSEETKCINLCTDKIYYFNYLVYGEEKINLGFDCAVNCDRFFSIISNIADSEMDISLNGNELIIKASSIKAKLPTLLCSDLFYEAVATCQKGFAEGCRISLPEDFWNGVYLCCASTTNDPIKGTLNNYHIYENKIESTNEKVFSIYNIDNIIFEEELLVPSEILFSLYSMDKGKSISSYFVKDKSILYLCGDLGYYAVRLVNGKFPNVASLLKEDNFFAHVYKFNKDEFTKALNPFLSFFDKDHGIRLIKEENKIKMLASSGEAGSLESVLEMESDPDNDINIIVNKTYLQKVIKNTHSFKLSISNNTAYFCDDNKKLTVLVALMTEE